jgi:hypothetical protein
VHDRPDEVMGTSVGKNVRPTVLAVGYRARLSPVKDDALDTWYRFWEASTPASG